MELVRDTISNALKGKEKGIIENSTEIVFLIEHQLNAIINNFFDKDDALITSIKVNIRKELQILRSYTARGVSCTAPVPGLKYKIDSYVYSIDYDNEVQKDLPGE